MPAAASTVGCRQGLFRLVISPRCPRLFGAVRRATINLFRGRFTWGGSLKGTVPGSSLSWGKALPQRL